MKTISSFLFGGAFALFAFDARAAELSPPEVNVVFRYVDSAGKNISPPKSVYKGNSLKASLTPNTTALFGPEGMPLITNGARAYFELFGRNDTTDATWLSKPLAEANIYSWSPTVGMRWAVPRPEFAADRMPVFVYPSVSSADVQNSMKKVFGGLGYAGSPVAPNNTAGKSRMDVPSFFYLSGMAVNAPVANSYVSVSRTWEPYNTSTWVLKPAVVLPFPNLGGGTSLRLKLGSTLSGWSNPAGVGFMPGPTGSNLFTVSGVETYTVFLEPFSPDNVLGRKLGQFEVTYWPQPQGSISVPPEKVVAGKVIIDGGDQWAPEVTVSNVYPGGRVYVLARALTGTFNAVIPGVGLGPTNVNGKPRDFGPMGVAQLEMIPPGNPVGNYELVLIHEYNGQLEVLATQPYTITSSISVRANITELNK
jgi:hypothetical protein